MMNTFVAVLVAVVPDLVLIVVGASVGARLPPEIWRGVDRLLFELLFPALLFLAASSRPIVFQDALTVGVGTWLVIGLGCGLGWLVRPWGPERFLDYAGAWQTTWRFNAAIAFVAIGVMTPDAAALMSVAIGFAVPIANVMAVAALSYGSGLGVGQSLAKIALNPFLLASVAGVAVGMSDLTVPALADATLGRLAAAAVPLALLSIGAAIDWRALVRVTRFDAALLAIKLAVLPAAAFVTGTVLDLDTAHLVAITVFAGLPTASASHVLASVFGADRTYPARLIAQSTVIGCGTLPLWISLAS